MHRFKYKQRKKGNLTSPSPLPSCGKEIQNFRPLVLENLRSEKNPPTVNSRSQISKPLD